MGCVSKVLNNPLTMIASDVAAIATGNPELIPLINGAERTAGGLSRGESFGKALGQGALSGAEAFAGSEVLGALGTAFPETGGALGLDTSGNSLTDILGMTNGAGSWTGAGTIGGDISSLFSAGAGGAAGAATTPGAGVTSALAKGGTPAAAGASPAAGPSAASVAAPGGGSTDWFDKFNAAGGASSLSKPLSGTVGSGTVGTPGIGGTANYDLAGNITSSPSLASTAAAAAPQTFKDRALAAITSPSALIAGGGLALDAAKGNQAASGEKALKEQASKLSQQGDQLSGYLNSGTLPAGLQQTLTQATNSAKATIRSKYASMGLSGSSSEQSELQAVDERAQAQGSQIALQLLNTGISETGMSSELYKALMNNSIENDKNLGSAISAFASAAGGGGAPAHA